MSDHVSATVTEPPLQCNGGNASQGNNRLNPCASTACHGGAGEPPRQQECQADGTGEPQGWSTSRVGVALVALHIVSPIVVALIQKM